MAGVVKRVVCAATCHYLKVETQVGGTSSIDYGTQLQPMGSGSKVAYPGTIIITITTISIHASLRASPANTHRHPISS